VLHGCEVHSRPPDQRRAAIWTGCRWVWLTGAPGGQAARATPLGSDVLPGDPSEERLCSGPARTERVEGSRQHAEVRRVFRRAEESVLEEGCTGREEEARVILGTPPGELHGPLEDDPLFGLVPEALRVDSLKMRA